MFLFALTPIHFILLQYFNHIYIYFHAFYFLFSFLSFFAGGEERGRASATAETQLLMRFAMERSGPLRPGVKTVEESVKSAVGPVYDKFHLVPDEILRHADTPRHHRAEHRIPVAARATASEMATRLYAKCEPVAEQCVASAWGRVKRSRVANAVVPKAAYCTEKYNEAAVAAAEKGYRVWAYLPLVPPERIAKLFL